MNDGCIEGCREGEWSTAPFGFVGLAECNGDLVGDEILEGDTVGEVLEGFKVDFTGTLVVGNDEEDVVDIDDDTEGAFVSGYTVGEEEGNFALVAGNLEGDAVVDGVANFAGNREGDFDVGTRDLEGAVDRNDVGVRVGNWEGFAVVATGVLEGDLDGDNVAERV
eukprot:gene27368-35992_t